ncbi:uncharacterized protein BJ171DRAFT_504025 [Polychytrium aggregatum]|uniref:uncharacterized protein n=1 Tax=Polychytrium aggregatum TaxID=110093 RepID=UPI0022FED663|nr:uncharacterized protein BJ171DRAFT_504025 [Polychytrium aggregatum]KAI9204911.1 hypothetical protein BJ171DRAFT_504025 [Polychytrium aggregatum]
MAFSSPQDEAVHWKSLYEEAKSELEELNQSYTEYQQESAKYEQELDKETSALKKERELLRREAAELKEKLLHEKHESNRQINKLQSEVDILRNIEMEYRHQCRELEILNSSLEQSQRMYQSTADDWESKCEKLLEKNIMLEFELETAQAVEVEAQRLRDELRDTKIELAILKSQVGYGSAPPSPGAHTNATLETCSEIDDRNPLLFRSPSIPQMAYSPEQEPAVPSKTQADTVMSEAELTMPQPHGSAAFIPQHSQFNSPTRSSSSPSLLQYTPDTGRLSPGRTMLPRPVRNRNTHSALSTLTDLLERAKSLEARISSIRKSHESPNLSNVQLSPRTVLVSSRKRSGGNKSMLSSPASGSGSSSGSGEPISGVMTTPTRSRGHPPLSSSTSKLERLRASIGSGSPRSVSLAPVSSPRGQ